MWQQLRSLSRRAAKQGISATALHATDRLINAVRNQSLVPPNTVEENLEQWTRFDWSGKGEEWTPFPAWKESLVAHVLEPNIPMGSRILEVGPGGGRWTEYLLQRGAYVTAVDLTPKCIEICRERFRGCTHMSFHVNDGNDLSFLAPATIDRVWSFDVFVHINTKDIQTYMRQFAVILVPGGRGIIHHAAQGSRAKGWRSDMTASRMREFCDEFGLTVVRQFSSWDDGRVGLDPVAPASGADVITIFEKPPA